MDTNPEIIHVCASTLLNPECGAAVTLQQQLTLCFFFVVCGSDCLCISVCVWCGGCACVCVCVP